MKNPYLQRLLQRVSSLSPSLLFCVFLFILVPSTVYCAELTFELLDNSKDCFYENLEKGKQTTFEFQVVYGGQYDVDVHVEAPNKQIIYKEIKKQYDTFTWTPADAGVYAFCFSNEFSTFSHKLVYFDLQSGEDSPLPGIGEHVTAMTQLESSAEQIHSNLVSIDDYQTHHRMREAQGRKRAEDLNERVLWWSGIETMAVLAISIAQVMILKNFFHERKPSEMRQTNPLYANAGKY